MSLSLKLLSELHETIRESPLDSDAQNQLITQLKQVKSEAALSTFLERLTKSLELVPETQDEINEPAEHRDPTGSRRTLRPGDCIPSAGINPTMVFRVPPQVLRSADVVEEKTDVSPPERGVPVTPEMGYAREDIEALRAVGDYRFGDILNQGTSDASMMPETDMDFDRVVFMNGLRNSISLSAEEKYRIIAALPQLSLFQIHSLIQIFADESSRFRNLSPRHLPQLQVLERRFLVEWEETVIRGLRMSSLQAKAATIGSGLSDADACMA